MLLAYFSVLNLDLDSSEPFAAPDGRRTTERAWLGELGVDSAPCLLILSAEGLPVGTVVARPPRIVLESMLEFVLTETYRLQPSFSHFFQHRLEHLRQHGIDVEVSATE